MEVFDWIWDKATQSTSLLLLLAGGYAAYQLIRYLGPDLKTFFISGVEANRATADAIKKQGPLTADTNEQVHIIRDTQGPAHKNTHDTLAMILSNQRAAARGLINGLHALESHYPEMKSKFDPAIGALREIESR